MILQQLFELFKTPGLYQTALEAAILLLLPVVLAGWVSTWFGSLGALVVALLLPVVLVADLAVLFVALGWWLGR